MLAREKLGLSPTRLDFDDIELAEEIDGTDVHKWVNTAGGAWQELDPRVVSLTGVWPTAVETSVESEVEEWRLTLRAARRTPHAASGARATIGTSPITGTRSSTTTSWFDAGSQQGHPGSTLKVSALSSAGHTGAGDGTIRAPQVRKVTPSSSTGQSCPGMPGSGRSTRTSQEQVEVNLLPGHTHGRGKYCIRLEARRSSDMSVPSCWECATAQWTLEQSVWPVGWLNEEPRITEE